MRILRRTFVALSGAALLSLTTSCGDSSTGPRTAPNAKWPLSLTVISGDAQVGAAGVELPQPLVAKVVDANGDAVAGQIVNFVVTAGNGTTFAGASISDAGGIVKERWTLGTNASLAQTLEARAVSNATGDRIVFGVFTADAVGGPAVTLNVVSGNGQTGPAGAALPTPLVVRALDQYGNLSPNQTVTWTAAANNGSASPGTSATNASGEASSTWTLGLAGPSALTARIGAGPSAGFTATATSVATRVARVTYTCAPTRRCEFYSHTSDAPSTITRRVWTMGDGTVYTGNSSTRIHTYAAPGTYSMRLDATWSDGYTHSLTVQVTVP